MPTSALQLQFPIVLVHGLGARNQYGPVSYFYGLPKLLREEKNQVFIPNLSSWSSIEKRALQLKQQIEKAIPEGKLNLIAHSLGGLDSRYLISQLGFGERVASLTTIGTPHRGTCVGDLVLKTGKSFLGGLAQVTQAYCQGEFAQYTPNHPQVAYYSASTAIFKPLFTHALPIFWPSYAYLAAQEGPNDGFVSLASAAWGHSICTHWGDHYAQIGQLLGRTRGLDYMGFYQEIFSRLKKDGM